MSYERTVSTGIISPLLTKGELDDLDATTGEVG